MSEELEKERTEISTGVRLTEQTGKALVQS
jgi:hypothetical protein